MSPAPAAEPLSAAPPAEAPWLTFVIVGEPTSPGALRSTLASLQRQDDSAWEALLCRDPGPEWSAGALRGARVMREDQHEHALRRAVGEARGEFVALLTPGDILPSQALSTVRGRLHHRPRIDLLYTDEAVTDVHGAVTHVDHKPRWSPFRLLGQPWTGRLTLLRTAVARRAWEDAGSEVPAAWLEYDLTLRVAERARGVARLASVLAHTAAPPETDTAPPPAAGVVQGHLRRSRLTGSAVPAPVEGVTRIDWAVSSDAGVAVVISTTGRRGLAWGDRRRFVVECVRSLHRRAGHRLAEVVVVHDEDLAEPVRAELRALVGGSLTLVPVDAATDQARRRNLGVVASSSPVVVLLDEHTQIDGPDLVPRLVGPLLAGGGLTGPRVLGTDGRVVDGGLAFWGRRFVGALPGEPVEQLGPRSRLAVTREVSGLGPTCLALTRRTFDEVGGLCERLPDLWHVDLARKVTRSDRPVLWVADTSVYRLAEPRLDVEARRRQVQVLATRWEAAGADPYLPEYVDSRSASDGPHRADAGPRFTVDWLRRDPGRSGSRPTGPR